jgi:NAD(P)-dependent dehydrogenase (short-subunit alcohol dehydrogenase family)
MNSCEMETVVIVGASSSIGRAISSRFSSADRVITTYTSRMPEGSDEHNALHLHLDLREDLSIERFVEQLKKISRRIDVVVFLSGILPGKDLKGYAFEEVDEVMAVNFSGQAKVLMRMLPLLTERSRLLMFSSISAQRGSFDPIYAASKGALLSFVKSVCTQLPAGARVNAVAPGLIQDSDMFVEMAVQRQEFHRKQVPSKQLLGKQALADIVFDICQPHWAHLNGACIDLNGGQYVR